MEFYFENKETVIKTFKSDMSLGLSGENIEINRKKFGTNLIKKKKQKSLFSRIFEAVTEPMLLILFFSLIITLGTNIGKYCRTGEKDFIECLGIFLAIILSVLITLIMEGASIKAFNTLSKLHNSSSVKVIRKGETAIIAQEEIVVGDIIILSSGDKIVADGRIIKSDNLTLDESALTGESRNVKKTDAILSGNAAHLADRINMAYSGSFITGGSGMMIATKVGDETELGQIAAELTKNKEVASPLQQKLKKLSKTITIIGGITAIVVFILSILRLITFKNLNFSTAQDAFITSIVLIVAAVPEGLPTIVAISLALNMTKLASGNALIKKLIATETAGAVSVICSDKTGTLTENKMTVIKVCSSEVCQDAKDLNRQLLFDNFCINSSADLVKKGKDIILSGSATECALLTAYEKATKLSYKKLRKEAKIIKVYPFSSDAKSMTTIIEKDGKLLVLTKGAYETIINKTTLTASQKIKITDKIKEYERDAKRIICFAHKETAELSSFEEGLKFDGYAVISDPIRPDVYSAVKECKSANIKVKMLTGDNIVTAISIAKELKILSSDAEAIEASELDKLSDTELKKLLPRITVIARSSPATKLRVVKSLKEAGEVVAVTGDGINDAPAIRQADVGFAMGVTGSEITKESADVILLDDSFSTIVKAVSFGRNVYRNLQRFVLFQLTVNLSAVMLIIISLLLGYPAPFNTLELLWINIIMDGPPALTLGLEATDKSLMADKPVKRNSSIVTKKMLVKIIIQGLIIATVLLLQTALNFLDCKVSEKNTVIFTLFIMFQLFNAFNSRELGSNSLFKSITKNKIMLVTFLATFLLHVFIVEVAYKFFGIVPMSFALWLKIIVTASLIIILSEAYKLIYRIMARRGVKGRKVYAKKANNFSSR